MAMRRIEKNADRTKRFVSKSEVYDHYLIQLQVLDSLTTVVEDELDN